MKIIWVGSPNFDTTRKPIKQVVIHWIVGNLASADAQFQKKDPGVSAHYGVEDETIHQYVKEEHTAYAVGVYSRNQETISIEHSASPNSPASDKTYETSGKLIADVCQRNNIPIVREHIIGHKEIKATQCPGTIDIDRLIREAKKQSPQAIIDQLRKERDDNWDLYSPFKDAGFPTVEDVIKAIEEKQVAVEAVKLYKKTLQDALNIGDKDWQGIVDTVRLAIKERDDTFDQAKVADTLWDAIVKQSGVQVVKYTQEGVKALVDGLGLLKKAVPEGFRLLSEEEYTQLTARRTLDRFDKWELFVEFLKRVGKDIFK